MHGAYRLRPRTIPGLKSQQHQISVIFPAVYVGARRMGAELLTIVYAGFDDVLTLAHFPGT